MTKKKKPNEKKKTAEVHIPKAEYSVRFYTKKSSNTPNKCSSTNGIAKSSQSEKLTERKKNPTASISTICRLCKNFGFFFREKKTDDYCSHF